MSATVFDRDGRATVLALRLQALLSEHVGGWTRTQSASPGRRWCIACSVSGPRPSMSARMTPIAPAAAGGIRRWILATALCAQPHVLRLRHA